MHPVVGSQDSVVQDFPSSHEVTCPPSEQLPDRQVFLEVHEEMPMQDDAWQVDPSALSLHE